MQIIHSGICAVIPAILLFGPVVIAIIIIAILLLLLLAALLIYELTKKPDDPLANAPGHDHSSGAANCPACQAAQEAVKATMPQKVNILFRPDSGWAGEYGFDWLREKDTAMPGDTDYKNIVGGYGAAYATAPTAVFTVNAGKYQTLRDTYYLPRNSAWKKNADGTPYTYLTPYLALFPLNECLGTGNNKQCKAKITLSIEVVDAEPDVLRVVYDKDCFSVDTETITPKTVGKNPATLTITCVKEFDTDKEIQIIPHKTSENHPAGRIMMLKNNKANRYKADVVFVKIQCKITAVATTGTTTNEQAFLEKYMFQSLTSLNIVEKSLDLTTDTAFKNKFVTTAPGGQKAIRDAAADGTQVHTYLENKFNTKVPGFTNHYKIFIFDEVGGAGTGASFLRLNGEAKAIVAKSVVVFRGHATSTTTHELMHAMGLYHTFDNNGAYVYQIGQTDNIMDYSHQVAYGSKQRIATWRWQWDKLHTVLQQE